MNYIVARPDNELTRSMASVEETINRTAAQIAKWAGKRLIVTDMRLEDGPYGSHTLHVQYEYDEDARSAREDQRSAT